MSIKYNDSNPYLVGMRMRVQKYKIIFFGDPVLRQAAKPVTVFHKKLHNLIDSMKYTLDLTDDGAALAANQIAVLKRITVINYLGEYLELINPEILEKLGESIDYEGCLSYPGYIGLVPRFETVRVRYTNRHGDIKEVVRSGNMARCMQHEIDHLNGILYIDRMTVSTLKNTITEEAIDLERVLNLSKGSNV